MFKIFRVKFLFLSCLTPLCLLLVYGCNNKSFDENKNNSEYIEKIEGVAALGQLNPLGEVRKLASPTCAKGGTPRLSKLFVREGDSII